MILATSIVYAQQTTKPQTQTPVFRTTTDYVSTDVIVRDTAGKFVSDLKAEDFDVLEDGVPQKVSTFVAVIGGRALTEIGPAAAPRSEGLILPSARPPSDTSGRIFIIFIDDLHLQPLDTPKAKWVLEQVRDTILHDGDLVGMVSTGYSSIATDITYDYNRARLNEAIKKLAGSGMTPSDIIAAGQTSQGPAGLRYNAQTAFSTAYDILQQAAKVTNRRKAFIYISSGYDFNPFKDSRYQAMQEKYAVPQGTPGYEATGSVNDVGYQNPFETNGQQFAESDLIAEVAELTRAARRANVTFYAVDPRGLIADKDINLTISSEEWRQFVDTSISSLKVLSDETGGFCICNTNEFKRGLQRVDNEMSDYYIIGYTSTNPDPLKIRRRIEIKVKRPGLEKPVYREQYTIKR
jgi:VWFA-related protein